MIISLIGAGALGLAVIAQRREEEKTEGDESFGGIDEALTQLGTAGDGESPRDRAVDGVRKAIGHSVEPSILVARLPMAIDREKVSHWVDEIVDMVREFQASYPQLDAVRAMSIVDVALSLDTHPYWLANLINFETNKTFSPSVKHPNSSAVGLIQFMYSNTPWLLGMKPEGRDDEYTLSQKKASREIFLKMGFIEQMGYVYDYLNQFQGRLGSQQALYMAVFLPAAMQWPPNKLFPDWARASNRGETPDRHAKIRSPRKNLPLA